MNESIGDRESIRAWIRARGRSTRSRVVGRWFERLVPRRVGLRGCAWLRARSPAPVAQGWRLGALGAASTQGGRHNEAPPHPFCPRTPSGLLRVSRGACSGGAIVAGPMALAVLGFGPGPMGMTGAVYIVPSDHYWEVI